MWLETNKTVIEGQFYLHFDQHGQVSPVLTHFLSRNSPKHPFLCSFKTEALDSNFFDFRQMKQVLTKLLSSMLCPHAVATPKQEIWSFWNFWLSPADCLTLTVPLNALSIYMLVHLVTLYISIWNIYINLSESLSIEVYFLC